ncbi:hypothetical protein CC79DRAFT_1397980 [Sarocladium strictum]
MIGVSNQSACHQALSVPGQQRSPVHNEGRIWHCGQCRQAFKKKGHLVRHTLSHTKQKPFVCDRCPKAYSRRDSLVRHERKHASIRRGPGLSTNDTAANQPSMNSGEHAGMEMRSRAINATIIPTNAINAQNSPSTSESLTNDAEIPTYHVETLLSEPCDVRASSTWTEILDSTSTELYGSAMTETLWFNDHFDLEAMGSAILDAGHLTGLGDEQFFHTGHSAEGTTPGQVHKAPSTTVPRQMEIYKTVQNRWFTQPIPKLSTPQPLIGSKGQDEVDEEYRAGLSTRLAPNPQDVALPSTDFLNLCVKLYFEKFQPLFPIIHSASFRPTHDRALVLLSMCSIGALFVGSDGAARCGRAIFTKLNKAILGSWEHYIHQGGREALSVAQAATLGQTFGILSGEPTDLLLTESFHGTIIAWARQAGIFRVQPTLESPDAVEMNNTDGSWRRWAQREETVRLILALQIHDSEFAKIFHHEGLLRHDQKRMPSCCSAEVFSARTASKWHAMLSSTQTIFGGPELVPICPPSSAAYKDPFYAYAQLAGHHAHISEARCSGLVDEHADKIRQRLTLWRKDLGRTVDDPNLDPLSLIGLWHQAFMALYVDFDFLERIIGRDGTSPTSSEEDEVRHWVCSDDGIRCAAHATLIIQRHSMQAISAESAIHVPLALFQAGIVAYCFTRFAGPTMQRKVAIVELERSAACASEITEQMGPRTFYIVTDVLRRLGHWNLSKRLASILDILIETTTNAEMQ